MDISTKNNLIKLATEACANSYSPYSAFCVGAALLCRDGQIFTGCNIENQSFGATNCAERSAFFAAISNGVSDFSAIAIVGYKKDNANNFDFCMPCGICRQVMSEFCNKDFLILLSDHKGNIKEYTLGELLPSSFNLN